MAAAGEVEGEVADNADDCLRCSHPIGAVSENAATNWRKHLQQGDATCTVNSHDLSLELVIGKNITCFCLLCFFFFFAFLGVFLQLPYE